MAEQVTSGTTGLGAFATPYAEYGLAEALKQYQQGAPAYYEGQTYAGFAPQTEQALRATEQRALAGSPVLQAGQDYLQSVLSGGFLGSNPYLEDVVRRASGQAQAAGMSGLSSRGRLGSGLGTQAVTSAVGDVASNIYYGDYGAERGRQQQALAYAPQYAAADYYDISQLANVGAAREALAQKGIDEAMKRYQYEATAPQQALATYLQQAFGYPVREQTSVTSLPDPSFGQRFLGGAAAAQSFFPQGYGKGEGEMSNRLYAGLLGGGLAQL
jgi:hypothetical protein